MQPNNISDAPCQQPYTPGTAGPGAAAWLAKVPPGPPPNAATYGPIGTTGSQLAVSPGNWESLTIFTLRLASEEPRASAANNVQLLASMCLPQGQSEESSGWQLNMRFVAAGAGYQTTYHSETQQGSGHWEGVVFQQQFARALQVRPHPLTKRALRALAILHKSV